MNQNPHQKNRDIVASNSTAYAYNFQCNYNPLDKVVELFEENKKLYERLLQSEREKVELLKAGK